MKIHAAWRRLALAPFALALASMTVGCSQKDSDCFFIIGQEDEDRCLYDLTVEATDLGPHVGRRVDIVSLRTNGDTRERTYESLPQGRVIHTFTDGLRHGASYTIHVIVDLDDSGGCSTGDLIRVEPLSDAESDRTRTLDDNSPETQMCP